MAHRGIIIVRVTLLGLLGCGRTVAVARDVTVDTLPVELTFAEPIPRPIGRFSLCFEFKLPGDSRAGSRMIVALRDSAGVVDTLRGIRDRTGEGTICLHDSTSRAFVGGTLTAPRRMTIRHVGWRVETR